MKPKLLLKVFCAILLFCFTTIKAQITPANNFISVDLNTPQNASFTYDSAMIMGKNLGMSRVGLHFLWTALETAPNIYDFTYIDIANFYYPAYTMAVDINIDPVETNHLEMPSDLTALAFDNPVVINRFKKLLDSVKVHAPALQISSLVIGSEIDGYISSASRWTEYTNFYSSVAAYAKTLWPGLNVACEAMFDGLTGYAKTYFQQLNVFSDYIGVSYYPLNSNFTVKPVAAVASAFDTLVSQYPSKPICFYQYGYPCGSKCSSSQLLQQQFITQTFASWDAHAANIKLIDFTWLHDMSPASVNYYSTYYGISDTIFLEFLGTLGLRTWGGNGTDRLALNELRCQAKQRGYNSLPVVCGVGISANDNEETGITLFPNPAQDVLCIETSFDLKNAELKIYNQLGQIEKCVLNLNAKSMRVETTGLYSGIYFIVLKNEGRVLKSKLIIQR